MNYKLSKDKSKPQKELQEIEDLVSAYEFAQGEPLNELAGHLIVENLCCKHRNEICYSFLRIFFNSLFIYFFYPIGLLISQGHCDA